LFAGFRRLLLRLEFVFAVIQDFDDGRDRVGGNLDQIEPGGLRHLQGGLDGGGAYVGATGIDQLNLSDADLLVDARTVLLNGRGGSHRTTNGYSLLMLLSDLPFADATRDFG